MPRWIVTAALPVVTGRAGACSAARDGRFARRHAKCAVGPRVLAAMSAAVLAAASSAHGQCDLTVRHDALLEVAQAGWSNPAPDPQRSATAHDQRFRLVIAQCGSLEAAASSRRDLHAGDVERGPGREAQLLAMYGPPGIGIPRARAAVARDLAGTWFAVPGKPARPVDGASAHSSGSTAPRRDAGTDAVADGRPTPMVRRVRALARPIVEAARRHRLDPLLLHAVAHVESRHDARARSPAGALGVMQVMPGTARRFGVADPARSLYDEDSNVDVGAAYLASLSRRFDHDLPLALAAYNAGEGAVERHGNRIPPFPETRAYVKRVLDTYAHLRSVRQRTRAAP